MKRHEFLRACFALGLSAPVYPWLKSCQSDESPEPNINYSRFTGKVLVIGAGAAGLIAGYHLKRHSIDFKILEASTNFGGRVREIEDFADFPLDLGAEWIHAEPSIFSTLLDDQSLEKEIELIEYSPQTISIWEKDVLRNRDFVSSLYSEYKFKNTTWYDFFDQYVVPPIADHIYLNQIVTEINYSAHQVVVKTRDQVLFEADKVILTVPLTILKQGLIKFVPPMPADKMNAMSQVDMPDGIKIFLKFSERFYPDATLEGSLFDLYEYFYELAEGEKTIYDAAFQKNSNMNILGVLVVGEPATVYVNQPTEAALVQFVLDDLDTIFDGQASRFYQDHVIQNWSNEPYIRGSYSHYNNDNLKATLSKAIDDKVFFAGEAYAPDSIDLATVHGAGQSASAVVNQILING